jgi:hypothetical protein
MTYYVEALNMRRHGESDVRRVGECVTLKDALKTAQQVIDESLIPWLHHEATVEELFYQYKRFGEVPFIFADDDEKLNLIGFNSLSYAMAQCEVLCARWRDEPALNAA